MSIVDTNRPEPARVRARYDDAQRRLRGLIHRLPMYDKPVLLSTYTPSWGKKIWTENGLLEALAYAAYDPEIARNTHELYLVTQREDGLIPALVSDTPMPFTESDLCSYGHIQQNVPFARTAWELSKILNDEEFLARCYAAAGRFDAWVVKYRDTRGTGMVEMFCEFDMGLDYSPRTYGHGIPRYCPGGDAINPTRVNGWPVLAPDLSAVIYGGRVALAAMADALGRDAEARRWREQAADLRANIMRYCYDAADNFFYDLDTNNQFRKYREMQLLPLCQEHVLDQALFDRLWTQYLRNPKEYWLQYPFPSVSAADPHFEPKTNSWSGATFLNHTIRTLLWMPHYLPAEEFDGYIALWARQMTDWTHWATIIDPRTGNPFPGDGFADLNTSFLTYTTFVDRLGWLDPPTHA